MSLAKDQKQIVGIINVQDYTEQQKALKANEIDRLKEYVQNFSTSNEFANATKNKKANRLLMKMANSVNNRV